MTAYTLTTVYPNGDMSIVELSKADADRAEKMRAADHLDFRMTVIREERDAILRACDWTQVADAPVDAKAWAAYRQALRDLPATVKDPTQPVDWPAPPE